jgi:signal transduction histidine kinase
MDGQSDSEELQKQIEGLKAQVALRTEQLMASTSKAYSFLDSLSMGFVMCDVNGEVVLTNDTVRRILDSESPAATFKEQVMECLKTGKTQEIKEAGIDKRMLHIFIAPMVNEVNPGDKQQIGAVMLVEDITEQKLLERSKDEFLSIASHELRTPLTAIRGNAALMQKYYGDKMPNRDVTEMVDDIHASSIRLIEIVNDFLDASSLEQSKMPMKPEAFALEEPINEVAYELQNLCDSKGLQLVFQPSESSGAMVMADKQRIKQVVYNLVGNAVKFTEAGSITISNRGDENFIYTLVTDTGRGLSPENQALLFRKFQQAGSSILTRDTTKGTGLGLYISKLIVELLGGRIGLEHSEPGQGSTFAFSLPRA